MTRTIAWPWTLTAPQSDVYTDPSRYKVLVAGRRFGKTILALTWLCTEVLSREPGSLGYYVAPFRVMAKSIAWDHLLRATREIRIAKNESELTVTLPGQRKIALKGADDPETLEGVGLVAAVLDEFARMKLAAWEKSLRPALSDKQGRVLFCGKPRGHNHLKTFYEMGQDGPSKVAGWRSWLFTTAQGGHVATTDIAEAKGTLPARVYRQEYESTFETLAGRVYDDFARSRGGKPWHVASHADIEREFKAGGRWQFRQCVVGVDWGLTNPGTMIVVGITGTGRCVVVHEEVHEQMLVSELGWLRIAKSIRDEYRPQRFTADPSEPGNIKSLRLALGANPVVENAQNDVAEGIRRVSVKLLPRENGSGPAVPGLVISDRCTNTIREIEGYVWREVSGVTTEEPVKSNDHCMDALRYAVMCATRTEVVR
jgi:hypothetical protein